MNGKVMFIICLAVAVGVGIAYIGSEKPEYYIEKLRSQNPYIRDNAATVLGNIGHKERVRGACLEEAILPLAEALEKEKEAKIRTTIIVALEKISGETDFLENPEKLKKFLEEKTGCD